MKTGCGAGAAAWTWGPRQCHVHRGASSHQCGKYGAISFLFFCVFPPRLWHLASKGLFIRSFSVAQGIRHLKGHLPLGLLVSCWPLPVGKEATVMVPPSACDSAVLAYLHGCPAFLPRYFPPPSTPSCPPPTLSLQSKADLTLGLLSNPHSPAPSHRTFQGTQILSRVCRTVRKIVWFSFHSDCHT